MASDKICVVVTTIFPPSKGLQVLADGAIKHGWDFVIVGDKPTPKDFKLPGADYFSLEGQYAMNLRLPRLCPERHYSRKNIGYLIAMMRKADIIIETDDDNIPTDLFWEKRTREFNCNMVGKKGWTNIYRVYSRSKIWPRGFPLEFVAGGEVPFPIVKTTCSSPVQQGLADANPDVDAVFRLLFDLPVDFERKGPHALSNGAWCPFNSQNTTWFEEAFPLLYLPSYCTFRMTDIWRSFVTQRIMWECGWHLVFDDASVYQERNEHNLIKDFEQEVPGYLNNEKIRNLLESLPLKQGVQHIAANLMECYQALVSNNYITSEKELLLLEGFLDDIRTIRARS